MGAAGATGLTGETGPAGPSNTTWIRESIATATADGAPAQPKAIATIGPFTVRGSCFMVGPDTSALFSLTSTATGARVTDKARGANLQVGGVGAPTDLGYLAQSNDPNTSQLPTTDTFSALSGDLGTYITGTLQTGVWMGGPTGPACQFAGFVTRSP